MGCQTDVMIDADLVFSICTHATNTGVLTDADSAPAYRIYEDEGSSPILTGTMAKLDDTNTTGFYSELIQCTAANGFKSHKSYNIYIQAIVDSNTGGISYGFRALPQYFPNHYTIVANENRFPVISSENRFPLVASEDRFPKVEDE